MKKLLTGSVVAMAFLFSLSSVHALEKNLLTLEEAYAIANSRNGQETTLDRTTLSANLNRSTLRRRSANFVPPRKSKLTHGFDREEVNPSEVNVNRSTLRRRSANLLPATGFRTRR